MKEGSEEAMNGGAGSPQVGAEAEEEDDGRRPDQRITSIQRPC
jgi:hypothetical protein